MTLVYFENGEHITLDVIKIEISISADELEVTYSEGTSKKVKIIEKAFITSINVQY